LIFRTDAQGKPSLSKANREVVLVLRSLPRQMPTVERLRSFIPRVHISGCESLGAVKTPLQGDPDMKHVSTSYAERNNLNVDAHSPHDVVDERFLRVETVNF